jgi:threonine dehydrogenase-like Zn-dependent dehydrogenase
LRAVTVAPGQVNSARLEEAPEPDPGADALLVQTLAIGVCGTDREILAGHYGEAPPSQSRLILGHESLGRVLAAPANAALKPGDLVAGIVRRPDPVPCAACAGGEYDMCRNGLYTEHGIKGAPGYGAERFLLEGDFAVGLDSGLGVAGVLLEPASIVAKAWSHIDHIGRRTSTWRPRTLLVTGAGPVGLLAALVGRLAGLETHVFDRVVRGPKPQLVADLGATYHHGDLASCPGLSADVVIECTGAAPVIGVLLARPGRDGVICLLGVSSAGHPVAFDLGRFNRRTVLGNDVVFGSVNANRAHYESAAKMLAAADPAWLRRLITRRVPLSNWAEAFELRPDDVKVVLDFALGEL